jgi:DUF4097 and DUF4098 domain-containing protein YvlB
MIGALMALSLVQQTDTVIALDGATSLDIENFGGRISVTTWDRPEIRIQADHSSTSEIEIRRRGSGAISVEAESRRGLSIVEFDVTVPASLDLSFEGLSTDVTVEGSNGEIDVETVEGNITIVGGSGSVSAETVSGEINIDAADGIIEASSVAEDVRVSNSSGEIAVETVGGSIILDGLSATVVVAESVGGRVSFDGIIVDGGAYVFASHGGTVSITIPGDSNALVALASVRGDITSDFPGTPDLERGGRNRFTIGNGGADIEVETFGGRIVLRRRSGGN